MNDVKAEGHREQQMELKGARLWAMRVVLLLVSFVIIFAAGEVVCRLLGLGAWIYPKGMYRTSDIPALGVEFTPGFTGRAYGTPVRINSRGFRGPDVSTTPAPGVYRIACVGDSVTFGMGVKEEEAWPAVLARDMAPPPGFDRVEVINEGVPGYNLRQDLTVLAEKTLLFSPNVIVLGVVANDMDPEYVVREGYLCVPAKKYSLPVPGKRWLQTHSQFWQLGTLVYSQLVEKLVGFDAEETPEDAGLREEMKSAISQNTQLLDRILRDPRMKATRLVIVRFDLPAESPLEHFGDDLKVTSADLPLNPRHALPDGHPNAVGHQEIATHVASVLAPRP